MTGKQHQDASAALRQLARRLGYRRDPAEPTRLRKDESVISINGDRFYDYTRRRGGIGELALVMHANNCGCLEALEYLDPQYRQQVLPSAVPQAWSTVEHHLCRRRALHRRLIDQCRQHKLLYAGIMQSAVFVRADLNGNPIGAELFGTAPHRLFHSLTPPDSKRNAGGFWIQTGAPPPVSAILVDNAIEALSMLQLYHPFPKSVLISATNHHHSLPEWLESQREMPTVIAFANTRNASARSSRLSRNMPNARIMKPSAETWNQMLIQRRGQPIMHRDRGHDPSTCPEIFR